MRTTIHDLGVPKDLGYTFSSCRCSSESSLTTVLGGTIPGYGTVSYVAFYMDSTLVSLVPSVYGLSAHVGDFLLFGDNGSIGLDHKQ